MECIIDLRKLGLENRTNHVLYACSDFIIYKEKSQLNYDDCAGETLDTLHYPFDTQLTEHCESGDDIVFMMSGKELIIKTGTKLSQQQVPVQRTGRGVTRIVSAQPHQIIFGSVLRGKIQFVNYDYHEERRIAQTSSWSMTDITDFNWGKENFFAVFDKSYVVACKYNTCEIDWQRLESSQISGKVLPYGDYIIYICDKNLKIIDDSSKAKIVKIPLVKAHHLECIIGDLLYFTSQEGKNLCCYNLRKQEMVWETPGKYLIHETLLVKGQDDTGVYDVLILRLDDHIAIVNLNRGKSLYYVKVTGIKKIRQTGNHVLLHKTGGLTTLLPGI